MAPIVSRMSETLICAVVLVVSVAATAVILWDTSGAKLARPLRECRDLVRLLRITISTDQDRCVKPVA